MHYTIDNVDKLVVVRKDDDSGDDNGIMDLFLRYAYRDVLYTSGERDTKQLGDQICHQDGYQGPSRQVRCEEILCNCHRKDVMRDKGK